MNDNNLCYIARVFKNPELSKTDSRSWKFVDEMAQRWPELCSDIACSENEELCEMLLGKLIGKIQASDVPGLRKISLIQWVRALRRVP